MKILLLKIAVGCLNIIYFFIKWVPTKNKITFISRQGNTISFDFCILSQQLKKDLKGFKIIVLTKRLTQEDGIIAKISYCLHIFTQMYHIATSKVVILDSYCLPISVLSHKKGLKVIQMWHSVGTMKKFGYSILDKKEGSNYQIAKALKMHYNYDYVFCASEAYKDHLAQGFHIDPSKIVIYPLPRLDMLRDKKYKKDISFQIYERYPDLKKKKTILYAPTFRKNKDITPAVEKLINQVDFEKYNFIVKLHPLDQTVIEDERVIIDNTFSSFDMLLVSDYIISDYSCFIYEAAFLEKPIFLYNFDLDHYMSSRDTYIDYNKDIPLFKSKDPKVIIKAIEEYKYDISTVCEFKKKYIKESKQSYSKNISNFIKQLL